MPSNDVATANREKRLRFVVWGMHCLMTLALVGFSAGAQAECAPTPGSTDAALHRPASEDIAPGNNLARPAGKSLYAEGQLLRLHGRVLDRACNPVAGAVVSLWQADRNGIYQIADRASLSNPYAVFAGAGRAVTDNTGGFEFTTLFPGATVEGETARAPHLNLAFAQSELRPLTTEFFFEAERRNADDRIFSALSPMHRTLLSMPTHAQSDGIVYADALVVLDGTVPYVHY